MARTIKYQKVNKLSDEDFKRVTGVSKDTFALMKEVVTKHYRKSRSKGGVKKGHAPSDQILMMLEYYREYRTYKHMAIDYQTSESTVCYTVKKIEEILLKDDRFHLPSLKKTRATGESNIEVIVVDVTESPIERPKKKQKRYYFGKKRRHTLKTQAIVTPTGTILSVRIGKGKTHDFKLFKQSKKSQKSNKQSNISRLRLSRYSKDMSKCYNFHTREKRKHH